MGGEEEEREGGGYAKFMRSVANDRSEGVERVAPKNEEEGRRRTRGK